MSGKRYEEESKAATAKQAIDRAGTADEVAGGLVLVSTAFPCMNQAARRTRGRA